MLFSEGLANGRRHPAFLRAVRLVDQKCNAELFQRRIVFDLTQNPCKLLLSSYDDWRSLREKTRQVVGLLRQPNHIFEMSKVVDLILDVLIQRFPIGENKDNVRQLFVRSRLEETVKAIREPADR